MIKHSLIISIVGVLVLSACEKVIQIPLNEAAQQTVIEGVLNDEMGDNYILLSRSSSVYTNEEFPKISNANVTVTDDQSNVYVFTEVDTAKGMYVCPTLEVIPETEYFLEVDVDGELFTAQSLAPKRPKIDSITTVQQDFGFSELIGYIPHTVYFHSFDDPAEVNYYRFKIWLNNVESEFVYIGNDLFINGQYFSAPFLGELAEDGDSVKIVMMGCDEAYYTYQHSLPNATSSGGAFTVAPGNPVGNIEGNAVIGYFTALTTDTLSYVIPL